MKSTIKNENQFDTRALHSAIDAERIARNLNWKEVAAQAKVSASTLTRLSQGKRPDVDSLAALTNWMGISADTFLGRRRMAFGSASSLSQISTILRDDPNLNKEAAAALDEMIKATYARLRSTER